MKNNRYIANKQQGAALAVSLIMLLLITVLATSNMRSSSMAERMAANSRNKNIAFQMAETALRQAEQALQDEAATRKTIVASKTKPNVNTLPGSIGSITCAVGKYETIDAEKDAFWNGTDAAPCYHAGTAADTVAGSSGKDPQYFIEFMDESTGEIVDLGGSFRRDCFYRITARGYGADNKTHVLLQTTYKLIDCI